MTQEPEQPNDLYRHEFNLDDLTYAPLVGHQWVQMGSELVCESCSFKHGVFLPADCQLYGIDDEGRPLIRHITVSD